MSLNKSMVAETRSRAVIGLQQLELWDRWFETAEGVGVLFCASCWFIQILYMIVLQPICAHFVIKLPYPHTPSTPFLL